ncbi:MAG: hypothetical protein IKJ22_03260 [Paludibacteraceae bacterium]|nr:hypothetical protein [Paludibacteraceae bacterium]
MRSIKKLSGSYTYSSLLEIYNEKKVSWRDMIDIVIYNKCYRDYFREYGFEALVKLLEEESEGLFNGWDKEKFIERMKDYKVASYDIKILSTREPVTILGHRFRSLYDIQVHCELENNDYYFRDGSGCYVPKSFRETSPYSDIHIGQLWERYPCFDSYDYATEKRTYQNYIFKKTPITKEDIVELHKLPRETNCCIVTDKIPEELLPVLYYVGAGDTMLLATK